MKSVSPKQQHGAALIALLLVLVLGGGWYLISRLNAASGDFTASNRKYNAEVLAQAKRALIGYVAHQAAVSGEDNPGAFPCPEAPGSFNSSTGTDGRTQTPSCTLPAVGRFPWRTIGTEKLIDASGEPLWYVVASGWSKPSSSGNTVINSNCTDAASAMTCWSGQLTVDGQANAAVALIIAPGQAFNAAAATGCTAWNQVRPASGAPDWRNYLECDNATNPADATFVTSGPSGSFNDQVVKITAAEVLPAIEATIADRFQKEFAPQLRTAYSGGLWPATPALPFAVTFANPTTSPANKLQGSAAMTQGLLPANYAFTGPCTCGPPYPCTCTPTACTLGSDPRCDPAFVTWRNTVTITRTGGATLQSPASGVPTACSVAGTPATLTCTIYTYWASMTFTLDVTADNAGMALRQINYSADPIAPPITGIDTAFVNSPIGYTVTSGTLNTDGSATVRISAGLVDPGANAVNDLSCGLGLLGFCRVATVSVPMALFSDHPTVDPSNTTYNWFYRNKWHEVSYYAVAPGIAPSGARSCTTSSTCLQVTYHPSDGKQRGVLLIAGPKLGTQVRPATALTDLLEGANADGASPFEVRSASLTINRTFNDRLAVIDSNP